ncbi:hypothetical protein PG996_015776 [Apiospora saccharicola]|uniref:FAD-binding PCMH-type domain-containing protein n=1 Tax=Apiospora saccharicola TaxID=335842 RepID=A0ABR1TMB9_9PEZI
MAFSSGFLDTHPELQVLRPVDPLYGSREGSYWAVNTRLSPACIVLPDSAQQLAEIVKELAATQRQFAIRSGGHSPVPGANDIADGVTVDLSSFNKIAFDAGSETVRFGAGARWKDVYGELTKHKRTVSGGRGGDVGVSGLLLGGGSSWMTAKNGWACDNVLSYEVVLADGRIIVADRSTHADLFQALKGGSNNFGIVTSFVMPTIPSDRVWGGIAATPASATSQVLSAMYGFTEKQGGFPDSYLMAVLGYFPDFAANVASTAVFQGLGDSSGPEFEDWRKLPKMVDMTNMATIHELSFAITLPPNYQVHSQSQDVLGSYGPENVDKMRQVAAKYDPDRVFQKLCPGGWKIPA